MGAVEEGNDRSWSELGPINWARLVRKQRHLKRLQKVARGSVGYILAARISLFLYYLRGCSS